MGGFKEHYFETKNKFNKEKDDEFEKKQNIVNMYRQGKTVKEIETDLGIKIQFPKDGDEKKFIISKTFDIVN